MPTYEYDCAKCGLVEVFQKMSESALTACPTCRSKRFARRISGGGGLIFKGSGFYETDYNRSQDYQSKSQNEAKPAVASATTSDAQGDAKPAAPAPADKPAKASAPAKAEPVKSPTKDAPAPTKPSKSGGKP